MQSHLSGQDLAPNSNTLVETAAAHAELPRECVQAGLGQLADALAEAVEKKDRCTGGHSKRTAHYALRIAREIEGLSRGQLERVRLAAILHDVGKIGIEDRILKKESVLDVDEWGTMRKHPQLGFEILGRIAGLEDVADGIRFHHERWDGNGYPQRLAGSQIPWVARLIAVADAYDAMVSTRPYRKGMSPKLAFAEIVRGSGTQFDPEIISAFERAFGQPLSLGAALPVLLADSLLP